MRLSVKILMTLGFVALMAACGSSNNGNNTPAVSCQAGFALTNTGGQNLCCPSGVVNGAGCYQATQACSGGNLFSQTYNQCLGQGSCSAGMVSYNNQCLTYAQAGVTTNGGIPGGYPNTGYPYNNYPNSGYPYNSGYQGGYPYGGYYPYNSGYYGGGYYGGGYGYWH